MEFLYPVCRQFPFDETCQQVVLELEKRNWEVPGIEVNFYNHHGEEEGYGSVWSIKAYDFVLHFARVQGRVPSAAAVSAIKIPKKELRLDADESGPTFYLYVGNNWEQDRELFFTSGSKMNSKLNGQPRMYLRYEGRCNCAGDTDDRIYSTAELGSFLTNPSTTPHRHKGLRSPLLAHSNDLGREYDPRPRRWNWRKWRWEAAEPKFFHTAEVMEGFKEYLEKVVLVRITSQPIPAE